MARFSPRYYVYLVFSLGGLYVGKGCGDRGKESKKERHGLVCLKVGRYLTQTHAYRAETRLIRSCRRLLIPLQNGCAPRTSVWRRLRPRSRRRNRLTSAEAIFGLVICALAIWWAFL
jgi:hypothetical protein